MSENLLQAPERGAIEAILRKDEAALSPVPSYERVLGFLTGAVVTPDEFMHSDWLQPLFDLNGIVVKDVEDIELLTASLISLFNRLDEMRLGKEMLCPFDLATPEILNEQVAVVEWATGLHGAVTLQEDLWIPYEDEVDWVDEKLKDEVNRNIQSLTTLIDPAKIPEMIKDPIPFQRNFLRHLPDWREDMLRETWDEELVTLFKLFCLGRVDAIMESLQRYSTAYSEGGFEVVDCSGIFPTDGE